MPVAGSASSLVPPQPSAYGLEAGKSTCCWPSLTPSVLPLSPAATHTVMPSAAASDMAAFIADSPCAVHESSDCPQLIEMAMGAGLACAASEIASTKPWSPLFGAKYTTCAAPGAAAPMTSMSRLTSTSAPLVSAGVVGRPVHAGRGDRRHRDAQAGEVRVQIAGGEPAAQLDDRDRLPGAGGAGREVVDVRHLARRVRGTPAAAAARRPEVRPGLRPGVQAEHRGDDAAQRGGQVERPLAVTVGNLPLARRVRAGDLAQRRAERAGQVAQGARHLDPPGDRVDGRDLQAAAAQLPPDQVHVGRIGAVPPGQLVAAQHGRPHDDLLRELGAPPQHQRDLGAPRGVQRPGFRGIRQRRSLAAGQPHQRSRFIRHYQPPLR